MISRTRLFLCGFGLLIVTVVAVAILKAPPDGIERGDFAQFLGRFHPLVVHLPIAFVLLVALLELAKFSQAGKAHEAAADFVLALAAASATIAIVLGWLLAWSGGYKGLLVTRHMWGGISLAALLIVAAALRGQSSKAYAASLFAAVCLLLWTSDQGGKLTHGSNFLTEHVPAGLRSTLHLPAPAPAPISPSSRPTAASNFAPAIAPSPQQEKLLATFFTTRVAPIFEDRCITCHGPDKIKGKLRLDTFENVMRGGKHGPVIKSGEPDTSELFRRINLPRDDEHAMPGEGKPGLTEAQIKVIELWIASGASRTIAVEAVKGAPPLPPPFVPLTADYRPRSSTIQSLQNRFAIRLVPRSDNPRDGLILRTVTAPARCDDAVLQALSPIADLIVDAELARTRVTDAGLKRLAAFSNLRALDLSHTAITSQGLAPLANLTKLESLNLTATNVDDHGVLPLRRKPGLQHLYLFETKCVEQ